MTKIVGISSFYHDSSVSLIEDGKIIYASQEERFSRLKHDSKFPKLALKNLLDYNFLKISDIDYFVYYEKPFLKFERLIETYLAFAPLGFKQFLISLPIWLNQKLFLKKIICDELKNFDSSFDKKKLFFSEHHISHAASAFFPSPFEKAIIFTADGVGEWTTTSVAIGSKNKIEIIKEINFPSSIGLLYSAFTYYIGFKVNSGEYKLMGLAPYGKPKYYKIILNNLIDIKNDGSFRLNQKYFDYATGFKMTSKFFHNLFGKEPRKPESEITEFYMDIAASIQKVTEEIILRILRSLKKEFKINNLCMAGGVALNCVVNGKIKEKNIFKNIWIQPAAGDAGGALGAGLSLWHMHLNHKRIVNKFDNMRGSYLGPSYDKNYVEKRLKKLDAKYHHLNDEKICDITAKDISQGKAVGWFQGSMEFGPRSLGNRSILADPRNPKMQKNLNLKIKFRESFRPFAPSILNEDLKYWFELDEFSPYMLMVAKLKKGKVLKAKLTKENKLSSINEIRSVVPAITHVDNSARIQTVHMETNYKFYKLLKKFKQITKVPILVNTSFNIRGEPIVCSPEDAFRCFMGNNLDILVIENFYLIKNEQNKNLLIDYKNKFNLD